MSLALLKALSGTSKRSFKDYVDTIGSKPRIAWYPSCGLDFRALLYLSEAYNNYHKATQTEPKVPDLFLYSDVSRFYKQYHWKEGVFFEDRRTRISILQAEKLHSLRLPVHKEVVEIHFPGIWNSTVHFYWLKVESEQLGEWEKPLLYIRAENEALYAEIFRSYKAEISHVIHVRYGGGFCGGGTAKGAWIPHVLKELKTELFVTDQRHEWGPGDYFMEQYISLGKTEEPIYEVVRELSAAKWSGYGDVQWRNII